MREGLLVEGVALVVAGDRGSQLLFRYPVQPYSPQDSVIPSRITDKASANQINVPLFGIRPSEFANLFCPKSALFGNVLSFLVGNHHFMSYPLQLAAAAKSQETTFFNVVLTLAKNPPPDLSHNSSNNSSKKNGNSYIKKQNTNHMFECVVERLAKILLHEQNRCGFITQEVQKILSMQDQYMAGATNKGSWSMHEQFLALKELTDKIVSKSLLANHLKKLVDQLHEKDSCRLLINDWCSLCVSLIDPDTFFLPEKKLVKHFGGEGAENNNSNGKSSFFFRPYQTLLLTQRSMTVLESLPKDCSPQLRHLVQQANPCHSFAELERLLEISLNQLYRLSAHLVYWGRARIVNKVSENYFYVVPSTLNEVSLNSTSAAEFGTRFPTQSLPEVLSRFCVHKKLSEHLKRLSMKAKEQELHMLLWMLQRQFVEQLHTFLYLSPHLAENEHTSSSSSSLPTQPYARQSSSSSKDLYTQQLTSSSSASSTSSLPSLSSPSSSPPFGAQLSPTTNMRTNSTSSSVSVSPRKALKDSPPSSTTTIHLSLVPQQNDTTTATTTTTTLSFSSIPLIITTPPTPVSSVIRASSISNTPDPSPRVRTHTTTNLTQLASSSFLVPSPSFAPSSALTPSPAAASSFSTCSALRSSPSSRASSVASISISVSPASPTATLALNLGSPAYSSVVPHSASPLSSQGRMLVANPTEVLFQRLKPYFNGEYDTTEICWREDVSPAVLDALCTAKPEEIIQFTTFVSDEEDIYCENTT